MKTQTFEKRLENSYLTRNSYGYKLAKELLTNPTLKIRTCWTSGSRRFTKNMDYTDDVMMALRIVGLKRGYHFYLENDAPNGGKPGNYIVLSPKGKKLAFK